MAPSEGGLDLRSDLLSQRFGKVLINFCLAFNEVVDASHHEKFHGRFNIRRAVTRLIIDVISNKLHDAHKVVVDVDDDAIVSQSSHIYLLGTSLAGME